MLGSFSLQAEAAHTRLARDGGEDVDGLWGGYLSASYFPTGETRTHRGEEGRVGRVKVRSPLQEDGGTGALELALRLDYLDLNGEGAGNLDGSSNTIHGAGLRAQVDF